MIPKARTIDWVDAIIPPVPIVPARGWRIAHCLVRSWELWVTLVLGTIVVIGIIESDLAARRHAGLVQDQLDRITQRLDRMER